MAGQFLYMAMSYGSMALVLAAIVVGVALTRGTIRKLLGAALVVTALGFLLGVDVPGRPQPPDERTTMAYGSLQWLLSVAEVVLLVAATVVGARSIRAKDAAIAALVDKSTPTWQQPKNSPDPGLLE